MVSLIISEIFSLALEGTKILIILSSCKHNIPLIYAILVLNLDSSFMSIKFSTFLNQNLEIQITCGFLLRFLHANFFALKTVSAVFIHNILGINRTVVVVKKYKHG